MLTDHEQYILDALEEGQDELSIRRWINNLGLNKELTLFLYDYLDEAHAIRDYRSIKRNDAQMMIYLGIFFIVIALFIGQYHLEFATLVFGVGFYTLRRGQRRKSEANTIKSLDQIIPKKRSIFHR